MGLDIYLYKHETVLAGEEHDDGERIEVDSTIDPEHYFKMGYFRSSYNDGGINKILNNLGVDDLYDIFLPNDEYVFPPNWNDALVKCNNAIVALENKDNYRVFVVDENIFREPSCRSAKDALDLFIKETKKECSFDAYSSGDGHYYIKEPLKVFGLISGRHDILRKDTPCTYVIINGENEWYIKALKIVKETIEYVLSKEDKEKYYLHWSG